MRLIRKILFRLDFLLFEKKIKRFPRNSKNIITNNLILGRYINIDIASDLGFITFKNNVQFKEFCSIVVGKNAVLNIGENVFLNNYTSINCLDNIQIGDNCQIGEGVKLYDHNHLYATTPYIKVEKTKFTTAPIIIGKECWVGSNVTILKGVTIGDNVIIGANNLIYKSIPSNTIIKAQVNHYLQQY